MPSLLVLLVYSNGFASTFINLVTAPGRAVYSFTNYHHHNELSVREGFFVVTLFWVVLGVVGSLPFIISLHLSPTDAIFESISGFTTTGATVIVGLDQVLPVHTLSPPADSMAGRNGCHCFSRCHITPAGCWRYAAVPRRNLGRGEARSLTPRIAETARVLWAFRVNRCL